MLDYEVTMYMLVGLVVLYFVIGRKYRGWLIGRYGYDFLGIPTFIAIAGPVINTLMAWFGIDIGARFRLMRNRFAVMEVFRDAAISGEMPDDATLDATLGHLVQANPVVVAAEPTTMSIVMGLLLFATPGVIIATVWCLIKTKNILLALLNIPLIYLISVVAGGGIAVAVMAVIGFILLKAFGVQTSNIMRGTDERGKCPKCGRIVRGPGFCPGCGVKLM